MVAVVDQSAMPAALIVYSRRLIALNSGR